jgi:hypothetical protein
MFLHIKGEKNITADTLSRFDANFNEKLPMEPSNNSMERFIRKPTFH